MKNHMNLKLWNKRHLFLRIVTFPIKLALQLTWAILSSILISFKWLKNGSQELIYGDDFNQGIIKLIEQNEEIIAKMNYKKRNNEKQQ